MWIFCCGMMRAGSTLQFQITAQLIEEAGRGKRVEWTPPEHFPEVREQYANYSGWKVFKAHILTKPMRAEFELKNALGVYVFRDIRDVMVSAMRKQAKSFEQLWQENYVDVCLRNFKRWTRLPGVLVSKYEEITTDLPTEVSRIAAHLGISLSYTACERIAAEYTMARQRERIELFCRALSPEQQSAQGPIFDPVTLLHTNHIYSGESGEWTRVLTPSQVSLIEEKAQSWLAANGYEAQQLVNTTFSATN
jgi:hypothetical protein